MRQCFWLQRRLQSKSTLIELIYASSAYLLYGPRLQIVSYCFPIYLQLEVNFDGIITPQDIVICG